MSNSIANDLLALLGTNGTSVSQSSASYGASSASFGASSASFGASSASYGASSASYGADSASFGASHQYSTGAILPSGLSEASGSGFAGASGSGFAGASGSGFAGASGSGVSIAFLSQIEQAILRSTVPIEVSETEEITVIGQRGLWANKAEVAAWRGDLAISEYKIYEDANPQIINYYI